MDRTSSNNKASSLQKEDQRKARRNAIIDAAEEVFATKPFNKVSMRDIAKQAGISPALIYRHFPDQQHLFVEAFLRGTELLTGIFDRILSAAPSAAFSPARGEENEMPQLQPGGNLLIEEGVSRFLAFLTEHEQYFKMMTYFMLEGSLNETLRDRLNAIERSMLDQFDRLFRKAGAKGNPRLLSHAFFASLNGILITFRQHPGRSSEEVREHMNHVGRIIARLFSGAVSQDNPDILP